MLILSLCICVSWMPSGLLQSGCYEPNFVSLHALMFCVWFGAETTGFPNTSFTYHIELLSLSLYLCIWYVFMYVRKGKVM